MNLLKWNFWSRSASSEVLAPEGLAAARWCAFGQSVLGAAHRRAGLPNQDALGWLPEEGAGLPVALAVADGHGSAKCFRSQEGSRLAVEAARQVVRERLLVPAGDPDPARLRPFIEHELPRELGLRWAADVRAHLKDNPYSPDELAALELKEGAVGRRLVEANPLHPYGSTLLLAVVLETFIAYLQLGDGDLLTIGEDGIIARPLRDDPRLFANETTSLSSERDWRTFRVFLQDVTASPPALILAFTDGYANSYPSVADPVAEFAADVWRLIGAHGLDRVRANLERWLLDVTENGSGDDITLGMLCRLGALPRHANGEGVA